MTLRWRQGPALSNLDKAWFAQRLASPKLCPFICSGQDGDWEPVCAICSGQDGSWDPVRVRPAAVHCQDCGVDLCSACHHSTAPAHTPEHSCVDLLHGLWICRWCECLCGGSPSQHLAEHLRAISSCHDGSFWIGCKETDASKKKVRFEANQFVCRNGRSFHLVGSRGHMVCGAMALRCRAAAKGTWPLDLSETRQLAMWLCEDCVDLLCTSDSVHSGRLLYPTTAAWIAGVEALRLARHDHLRCPAFSAASAAMQQLMACTFSPRRRQGQQGILDTTKIELHQKAKGRLNTPLPVVSGNHDGHLFWQDGGHMSSPVQRRSALPHRINRRGSVMQNQPGLEDDHVTCLVAHKAGPSLPTSPAASRCSAALHVWSPREGLDQQYLGCSRTLPEPTFEDIVSCHAVPDTNAAHCHDGHDTALSAVPLHPPAYQPVNECVYASASPGGMLPVQSASRVRLPCRLPPCCKRSVQLSHELGIKADNCVAGHVLPAPCRCGAPLPCFLCEVEHTNLAGLAVEDGQLYIGVSGDNGATEWVAVDQEMQNGPSWNQLGRKIGAWLHQGLGFCAFAPLSGELKASDGGGMGGREDHPAPHHLALTNADVMPYRGRIEHQVYLSNHMDINDGSSEPETLSGSGMGTDESSQINSETNVAGSSQASFASASNDVAKHQSTGGQHVSEHEKIFTPCVNLFEENCDGTTSIDSEALDARFDEMVQLYESLDIEAAVAGNLDGELMSACSP